MRFKTSDLDTKIKDIIGSERVDGHTRTLREQIQQDEERFGIDHGNLDILDDFELNVHIDYLEYLHAAEGTK